jgi:hypothetical protein
MVYEQAQMAAVVFAAEDSLGINPGTNETAF